MKPFPAEIWYDSVHDCSIFSILQNEITMIFTAWTFIALACLFKALR